MSIFPTGFDPKTLPKPPLQIYFPASTHTPKLSTKKDIGPHLLNFLSDPAIKYILNRSEAPGSVQDSNSGSVDLQSIRTSLSLLAELALPEAEGEYHNVEHPEPQGLAYASPA